MPTQYVPRPGRFPFHAETLTVTLPTVAEGSGYVGSSIADPAVANAIGQSAGRWVQQFDLAKLEINDIVSVSTPVLVRGQSLEYPTGAGLANLTPTQTPAVIGGGGRIDWDETVLSIGGANPITFPANARTWIYGSAPNVGEYPAVRIESVALATPAAPQTGEIVLGGVDTNATQVTTLLPSDVGDRWHFDVSFSFEEPIIVTEINGTNVTIDVDTLTLDGDSVDIIGDLSISGAGADSLTCSIPATFTSSLTVQGNTALGNASGDTLTVQGTATFVHNIVVQGSTTLGNGGADTLTINAAVSIGGNGIEGTAGSVIDVENVEVTELRWDDSGTILPGTPGEIRWNGTFFAYHDQTGTIRTLDEPVRGYDASFSTALAIADTTAVALRRIQANEPVWIEISCRYEATDVEDMAYRVQVDGPLGTAVIISDDVAITAANKGYSFFQAFLWTPTDDFAAVDPEDYLFTVGLGIGGVPTLTATHVSIKVSSYVSVS